MINHQFSPSDLFFFGLICSCLIGLTFFRVIYVRSTDSSTSYEILCVIETLRSGEDSVFRRFISFVVFKYDPHHH